MRFISEFHAMIISQRATFNRLILETLAKPGRGSVLVALMFSQGRSNVLVARFDTCFICFLSQRGRCPSHARGFTSASLLNYTEKSVITDSARHLRRAASIRYTATGRSPRDRRPNSSPYGNATSTVKNRNDGSPPSGTFLHFHLILELQLTTPTKFPFTFNLSLKISILPRLLYPS